MAKIYRAVLIDGELPQLGGEPQKSLGAWVGALNRGVHQLRTLPPDQLGLPGVGRYLAPYLAFASNDWAAKPTRPGSMMRPWRAIRMTLNS
jgi:hypothetical protein